MFVGSMKFTLGRRIFIGNLMCLMENVGV